MERSTLKSGEVAARAGVGVRTPRCSERRALLMKVAGIELKNRRFRAVKRAFGEIVDPWRTP